MGNQKCLFPYPITYTTILFSATATIVYKKGETHHLHQHCWQHEKTDAEKTSTGSM